MWNQFVYEDDSYLIKIKDSPIITLFLTDLKSIWSEELEGDSLELRFKELNALYVSSDVLGELTALVGNIGTSISLSKEETEVTLEVKSAATEYPLKFCWQLKKLGPDAFFEEVTLGLVRTIQALELQQQSLCGLLERKDAEIKEYKREKGGEISRDYLKTPVFSRASINKLDREKFVVDVFTNKNVLELFSSKYGDVTSNIQSDINKVSEVKKRKLKPYVSKRVV